ncbi:MAG TPA: N-acetylmuramoyl-L-alanine amidase-like domain-containing protein [Gemmatimonadales bacterium]|nr:N-acetylmuramoyl-L-alanine amidase-like domain-containing protein [Gemmatimonadales bacterium]
MRSDDGLPLSRRDLLRNAALAAAALGLPAPLAACRREPPGSTRTEGLAAREPVSADEERLARWSGVVRSEGLAEPERRVGRAAARVGELAAGTPYEAHTLEAYVGRGGDPVGEEPLTLSLTRFDCVTLVEGCLAVARVAGAAAPPSWDAFGAEVERMRYRGGVRRGYASRLHYFSEWIADGESRGLVRDIGAELGGVADTRPLRFMTEHRDSYPALVHDSVFQRIAALERRLDGRPRIVVPTSRIPEVARRIETGDVLAFATGIPGLDVTHTAFAYRDAEGVLRVLHAPLSGGVVEVTRATLPEYVAAIRRSTGILVARPAWSL